MSDDLVKRARDRETRREFDDWGILDELAARIEALTAERDALQSALAAALERLDASLFTNAEHQQAKDILRNAIAQQEGAKG